jgi:acid phosphatase type 7
VVDCSAGSAQETWLKADLAAHPAVCTLVYFHHPLFSSGSDATPGVLPLWDDSTRPTLAWC